MTSSTRRAVLLGAASLSVAALGVRRAHAAEYTYKIGTDLPVSHPLNIRVQEASDRILKATDGKFELKLFANNQLGSSSDQVSQTRSGAIDFFMSSGGILSPVVPAAAINAVGFAFKDYDAVWRAMDGPVGSHVREELLKRGLIGFDKVWDNGFRHVTTAERIVKTPEDMKGFKIRVPLAPLYAGMFKALDASPTSINLNEVYSALQTKIVDGQENPVSVISSGKFYEVQKTLSLTGHIWDGAWLIANQKSFEALPPDIQQVVRHELDRSALDERADVAKMVSSTIDDLKSKGMNVQVIDQQPFREQLKKAGFYAEWQKKFGDKGWGALESVAGSLV